MKGNPTLSNLRDAGADQRQHSDPGGPTNWSTSIESETIPPLLTFYERLAGEDLPGDACVSYGFDAATNGLVFTLRRLDDEVVSHVHERVPADAVRITVEPRSSHAIAI